MLSTDHSDCAEFFHATVNWMTADRPLGRIGVFDDPESEHMSTNRSNAAAGFVFVGEHLIRFQGGQADPRADG